MGSLQSSTDFFCCYEILYRANAARRLALSLYQTIGAISMGTPVKKASCKSGVKAIITKQNTCDQMPNSVT